MPTALLTIRQLSERSATPASALRYYETLGLLTPARTPGRQRRYLRGALRRVAVIRAARAMGVPLSEIVAAFAALPAGRDPTRGDWQRLSRRWQAELSRRIEVLTRLRDHLGACIGCGCLSLDRCQLVNRGDRWAKRGAGASVLFAPTIGPGTGTLPKRLDSWPRRVRRHQP